MSGTPSFDSMAMLFPHVATTGDIHVRVAVSYLPEQSAPKAGRWFWSYHVRIENDGERSVQLLSRHWRITDARGTVNIVDGEGVVGEKPVLDPGQSHDYVSGCPLSTPHGTMEGFYTFHRITGGRSDPLEVRIPFFPLAAPAEAG